MRLPSFLFLDHVLLSSWAIIRQLLYIPPTTDNIPPFVFIFPKMSFSEIYSSNGTYCERR
ncbi:hypothetical protein GLYMA_06G007000v4 [Glycine max]|nr:hypothetical protein GLYMA_06G007000v4 [Glycine max]